VNQVSRTTAAQVSHRSTERTRQSTAASRRTVLIALASNATVAVVKAIGGLMSGSTAMLAEAAHSVADTSNQAFLLVSIALGSREPSPDQPFGYAQMRFLWTFMAAVGMFLAGAVFAIGYGVYELLRQEEQNGFAIAYITLAIAFLLLVGVAVWMGRDVSHLLIGGAARPEEREVLERAIAEFDEVDRVVELLTMALGPNALLVAARVDLSDSITPGQTEEIAGRIDERLREVVPDVTEVFLDPTRA
jgi:divalent metal cation (Fe/Co/Zn/Cd) transporter